VDSQNNPLERHKMVQEEFLEKLGLALTDAEVNALLEGNAVSVEQLIENHTLTEIGTALIRWDTLAKDRRCNDGEVYMWPFGCVPTPDFIPLSFRLPRDWLS